MRVIERMKVLQGRVVNPMFKRDVPKGRNADYQHFFQILVDNLRKNHRCTKLSDGSARNWQSFSSGTRGITYAAAFASGGRVKAEIYIDLGDRTRNLSAFDYLKVHGAKLTHVFGESLKWERLEGRRACRIAVCRLGSIDDPTHHLSQYQNWLVDRLLQLRSVFGPLLHKAAFAATT
jgi:hypothetical protein